MANSNESPGVAELSLQSPSAGFGVSEFRNPTVMTPWLWLRFSQTDVILTSINTLRFWGEEEKVSVLIISHNHDRDRINISTHP